MAYKFNPFTGKLDETGNDGLAETPPSGSSDTEVIFNDAGTLAGDTGLTFNKTTDSLTVGGDLNLSSGGAFSTTVQAITPTANRTISFPDQTGTVGLVGGSTGNIQYNDTGKLAATSDFNVDLNWTDAGVTYTGLKVNVTDTASAAGSKLLDLQSGGTSKLSVDADGYLKQTPVTVASLPAAATVGAGTRGFVSDATATTFASVVAGSGSNNVPVYSDGTDWRIG